MNGLEQMEAIRNGRIDRAPIQGTLGFDLVEVGDSHAVFSCVPGEQHLNPAGTVHGGLAATLLDSAMGCAVHTTLPEGGAYGTLEMKVNLVRAITPATGEIRSEGTVVHRGSQVATAEARLVRAEDGKLLAHATCTCLIIPAAGAR